MCGIVGFVEQNVFNADKATLIIKKMTNCMFHRGPDDNGYWLDIKNKLALGHRRLSVIDTSKAGVQPMISNNSRYVIVFNGEIYNHKILREKLKALNKSQEWKGNSDTETILACIEVWGLKKALTKFTGMFAMAIWDRKNLELFLARDRFGEKPLYYGHFGETYVFASELKAINLHPKFENKIDKGALTLYMRHNYVPTPYTIFKDIFKLPPGTFVKLGNNEKPKTYWSLEDSIANLKNYGGTFEESMVSLDEKLSETVKLQMIADVSLGAFLSGGIDSSLIVSKMQEISTKNVETFNIGFEDEEYNEAIYAKPIAKYLGTDHNELYIKSKQSLDVIPSLPEMYDEPFADSSQIPTYLISKLARKKVTVCLSGDGGDELFGGYNRYTWTKNIWNLIKYLPISLRRSLSQSFQSLSPSAIEKFLLPLFYILPRKYKYKQASDKLYKLSKILSSSSLDEVYLKLISHFEDPADLVLGGFEASNVLNKQKLENFSPESKMMFWDTKSYLTDDILTKVDRAAMSVSLETRMPFLDHRIVEFAWSLPLNFKIRNGKRKVILNELLAKKIPRKLIERPKMGFGIPLQHWLRNDLREWSENLLDKQKLREQGFFNENLITTMWNEHKSEKKNLQYKLWNVLMFQAWIEKNKFIF